MGDEWLAEKKQNQNQNHAESLLLCSGNANKANNANGAMDLDADSDFGPETNVDYVDTSVNGTALKHALNNDLHPLILPAGKTVKEDRKIKLDRESEEEDDDEEDERWDYIKGDIKEEESSIHKGFNNHQQVDIDCTLNPNAAEFVPTSPVEKSCSASVTNPGLTNNVPFSPDACKSAFFENSSNSVVCDLNKTNYEFSRSENESSATNGIEKDGDDMDVNSFDGTKDSEHSTKGSESDSVDHIPAALESHLNDTFAAADALKVDSSSESFFPNLVEANHKSDGADDSALLSDSESLQDSMCNKSNLYSDISVEKPHDFSDPVDSSQLNNLEYSAVSPEKPHEFSLLDNASSRITDTNEPEETPEHPPTLNGSDFANLDPFNVQSESKSNPFGSFETQNVEEKAGSNVFSSDEIFECQRKDDVSKLKNEGFVFSPDEEFDRKRQDSQSKLKLDEFIFSSNEELECKRNDDTNQVRTDELTFSVSSEVEVPKEIESFHEEETTIQDTIEKNAENIFGITESLEQVEIKILEAPVFGSGFTSEPIVTNEQSENFNSSNILVSEGDQFCGSEYINDKFVAEDLASEETALYMESKKRVEPNIELVDNLQSFNKESVDNLQSFNKESVDNLQIFNKESVDNLQIFNKESVDNLQSFPSVEIESGKGAHSNPFSDFSSAKEGEESSVLIKNENFSHDFDEVAKLSENIDAFGISEPVLKTEEPQETGDLLCSRENIVDDTESSRVEIHQQETAAVTSPENPFFSQEVHDVSEDIQNLEIKESIHASTPFSLDSSTIESKEVEEPLNTQDDQTLISQLTTNEEFSNSEDVVNKLTEEFEKSEGTESPVDSDLAKVAMATGAAAAVVGVAAVGVAVADKSKKPAATAVKKAALKPDGKSVVAKTKPATTSKPAASLQSTTKPAAKSPAPSPKKTIPPKASPAKTSMSVTRAAPSAVLKSKVAATSASAPAAKPKPTAPLAAKPKTTLTATKPSPAATTRPRATLTSTNAAAKPTAKPLTNGIASRPTSTLTKRPLSAPSTPKPPTTTTRTSTAPKPLPRTATVPKTSVASKTTTASTTVKSSLSSRPTTIPPKRPLGLTAKTAADKKEPSKTLSATPRTALTARKLDVKKTSANSANDASKTAPTKPPAIRRMPPKVNQTEEKTEAVPVVANGSIEPKDNAVEIS